MLFFGLWLKDVLIKPIKIIFHKEIVVFIVNWLLFPVIWAYLLDMVM
tara:strand:+ start:5988 stop:6128 length:141 start_codon:yes stop_codon:yes gene_type:complete